MYVDELQQVINQANAARKEVPTFASFVHVSTSSFPQVAAQLWGIKHTSLANFIV